MHELFPQIWMINLMYAIIAFVTLITFLCLWYIVEKMKQPGWKGIIPYYNIWVLIKTMGKPIWWFWIQIGAIFVLQVFSLVMAGQILAVAYQGVVPSSGALFIAYGVVVIVLAILLLVFQVLVSHALSKSFGRSGWFTLGLLFLPVIFFPILAFGDDEFIRPEILKPQPAPVAEPEIVKSEAEIAEESAEGSE